MDCISGELSLTKELEVLLPSIGITDPVEMFLEKWFSWDYEVNTSLLNLIKDTDSRFIHCLATNQPKERYDYLNDKMKLNDIFQYCYSSHHFKIQKPDVGYFYHILVHQKKENNIDVGDVIFFDDKSENIEAAQKVGIRSILCDDFKLVESLVRKELNI